MPLPASHLVRASSNYNKRQAAGVGSIIFQQWKLWPLPQSLPWRLQAVLSLLCWALVLLPQLRLLRLSSACEGKKKRSATGAFHHKEEPFSPQRDCSYGRQNLWTARLGCFTLRLNPFHCLSQPKFPLSHPGIVPGWGKACRSWVKAIAGNRKKISTDFHLPRSLGWRVPKQPWFQEHVSNAVSEKSLAPYHRWPYGDHHLRQSWWDKKHREGCLWSPWKMPFPRETLPLPLPPYLHFSFGMELTQQSYVFTLILMGCFMSKRLQENSYYPSR